MSFKCLGITPGGQYGAFRLNPTGQYVECLSTIRDITMDRFCHFFSTKHGCKDGIDENTYIVNAVQDDYTNVSKYWSKAKKTLSGDEHTGTPVPSNSPPIRTKSPLTSTPSPSTMELPSTSLPTTIPLSSTTVMPETTSSPTESPTATPLTVPVEPLVDSIDGIQFDTISPDWDCRLHYNAKQYTAAHIVNDTYECLGTDNGCYYSKTKLECKDWMDQGNQCWLNNSCVSIRIKILGRNQSMTPVPTPSSALMTTTLGPISIILLVGVSLSMLLLAYLLYRRRALLARAATDTAHFAKAGTTKSVKSLIQRFQRTELTASHDSPQMNDNPLDMGNIMLWELDPAQLKVETLIYDGKNTTIHAANYKGRPVAVKALQAHVSDRASIQNFLNEINMHCTFESPYLVSVVGCCCNQPARVSLILELMDLGDLRTHLRLIPRDKLPWRTIKQELAHQIVQGIVYLHSMDVMHREIVASNVLIDSQMHIKWTDFGSASDTTSNLISTIHVAPEILQGEPSTEASDIYSLGLLLFELDHHHPIDESTTWQTESKIEFTAECPKSIQDLALACISKNPQDRPSILSIASTVNPSQSHS